MSIYTYMLLYISISFFICIRACDNVACDESSLCMRMCRILLYRDAKFMHVEADVCNCEVFSSKWIVITTVYIYTRVGSFTMSQQVIVFDGGSTQLQRNYLFVSEVFATSVNYILFTFYRGPLLEILFQVQLRRSRISDGIQ